MIIPRVVDAFRSLANWNRSFFWCTAFCGCNKSLAIWLLWAKFEIDERILFVVVFWLLSEGCLCLSFTVSFPGTSCVGDLFIVWIGFVGVFGCCNIGHWDSLDFLWPLKHLPIVLSVLSTLHCNKNKYVMQIHVFTFKTSILKCHVYLLEIIIYLGKHRLLASCRWFCEDRKF